MLERKYTITHNVPSYDAFTALIHKYTKNISSSPVFYDIETTGLSKQNAFVYLIGILVYENDSWNIHQFFAENPEDEARILLKFSEFIKPFPFCIQYNGTRFDQPFLEERLRQHQLETPFSGITSLDLYQTLKPLKSLLKLSDMKQPQLEAFLHSSKRTFCDGKEGIRLYRNYLKSPDPSLADILLGHNEEDLTGLLQITKMHLYLRIYSGEYEAVQADLSGDQLVFEVRLPLPLPTAFSNGTEDFYLTGNENRVKLLIRVKNGRIRQYYENYKDYSYLPAEDMALPKSLSAYMDKSLCVPATKQTCYTWIICDEAFLSDKEKQLAYLRHTLPCLLNLL